MLAHNPYMMSEEIMMHKIFRVVVVVSFGLAGLAFAQSPEQIADLKERIQAAWETGDSGAF